MVEVEVEVEFRCWVRRERERSGCFANGRGGRPERRRAGMLAVVSREGEAPAVVIQSFKLCRGFVFAECRNRGAHGLATTQEAAEQ